MAREVTLSDDAYEKLERHRREDKSFTDVVRRLAGNAALTEYHGALDESTAEELSRVVESR
ncbi:antitoxin VapB family protein [Halosimplex halobium]|uniref:antitoxin VapB family protein n=1 Tax=Halosimplex halobium TaxID=3396618 RepID=UPI003F564DF4